LTTGRCGVPNLIRLRADYSGCGPRKERKMKDFWEAAGEIHQLYVIELKKYDWPERVEFLRQSISTIVSETQSQAGEKSRLRDFWSEADSFLQEVVGLYFLAIAWELISPLHEEVRPGQWKMRRDASHRDLAAAQEKWPVIQASRAIDIFRSLPIYGSANMPRLSSGGDPEMAGADILVYEKTRSALLAKIIECWATTESEEAADKMLGFLIEVLLAKNDLGPYGSSVVATLRPIDSQASAARIEWALMRIYPEMANQISGPILDAFNVLKIAWVKKLPAPKIRFLAEMGLVLDRSLPEAAEREMIAHAEAMMNLKNVTRSFIDHSGRSISDWDWLQIDLKSKRVELALHFDSNRINSVVEEMRRARDSWQSPDPSVQLIIHGRKQQQSFGPADETDFFEMTVGRQ